MGASDRFVHGGGWREEVQGKKVAGVADGKPAPPAGFAKPAFRTWAVTGRTRGHDARTATNPDLGRCVPRPLGACRDLAGHAIGARLHWLWLGPALVTGGVLVGRGAIDLWRERDGHRLFEDAGLPTTTNAGLVGAIVAGQRGEAFFQMLAIASFVVFVGSAAMLAARLGRYRPGALEGPLGPRWALLRKPWAPLERLERSKGFSGMATLGGEFSIWVLLVQGTLTFASWLIVECLLPLVGWLLGGPFVAFGNRCVAATARTVGPRAARVTWFLVGILPGLVVGAGVRMGICDVFTMQSEPGDGSKSTRLWWTSETKLTTS